MSELTQLTQSSLKILLLGTLLLGALLTCCLADEDEVPREDPHRDPSLCEVCKYLTTEVMGRLTETGKTHEVIETGYGLDQKKKRKEYKKSELRLIEVINDPHVCDKILEYNVHAERKGSLRFSKGRSQTMETLHNLVDKGVKVELGIPYDMWDNPSASVTEMQRQCFKIVEQHEEAIEDWYWNHQDKNFTDFLCVRRVLRSDDRECLSEVWAGEKKEGDKKKPDKKDASDKKKKDKKSKKTEKKNLKGDTGSPDLDSIEDDSEGREANDKPQEPVIEKKDEL